MNQPELFDIVELLIDLAQHELQAGAQGTTLELLMKFNVANLVS